MANKSKLDDLFWKDNFGPEFIQAAKDELPYIWGRLSLLEEFYDLNAPGFSDRSRCVSDQLGKPHRVNKDGLLRKLRVALGV